MSEEGRCDAEILTRIGIVKANFGSLKKSVDRYEPNNETAKMLRMVWDALRLRELEYVLSNTEESGRRGDVLYKENAESAVDGDTDKPRSDADGGYLQETGDHNTAEATEVPGSRIEGEQLREGLSARYLEGARAGGRQRIKFMDGIKTLL